MAMVKPIAVIAALISFARPLGGAIAQTLSSTPVFDGSTTTLARDGTKQAVHISVQSWAITGQKDDGPNEIPLGGFYVAHLLSGVISTTIDGHTTMRPTGSYWTVGAGAVMQVKAIGEAAILETIVTAKQ